MAEQYPIYLFSCHSNSYYSCSAGTKLCCCCLFGHWALWGRHFVKGSGSDHKENPSPPSHWYYQYIWLKGGLFQMYSTHHFSSVGIVMLMPLPVIRAAVAELQVSAWLYLWMRLILHYTVIARFSGRQLLVRSLHTGILKRNSTPDQKEGQTFHTPSVLRFLHRSGCLWGGVMLLVWIIQTLSLQLSWKISRNLC